MFKETEMILKQFPEKQEFLTLAETCNVIPVCTQILADMETPVSIFAKISKNSSNAFLLSL